MRHPVRVACLLLTLATPLAAETLRLTTVDFKLPEGFAQKIPSSVRPSDIFVSDDACYYVRKDLSFVFIGCVG